MADLMPAVHCLAAAFAQDDVARYFTHTCPDTATWAEERRWALHVQILTALVRAHLLKGLVLGIGTPQARPSSKRSRGIFSSLSCVSAPSAHGPSATPPPRDPQEPGAGEAFDAVALWLPPGAHTDDLRTILRSGLWRLRLALSAAGRARFFREFLPLLHETKAAVLGPARDPHAWYLVYLGTRPGARGNGFGTCLVRYVTEGICDAGGAAAAGWSYLESSNVANLRLYSALGFEVVRRIALVGNGVGREVGMDIMVRAPLGALKTEGEAVQ